MHYEISRQLAHSTIIRVVTKFRIEFGKSMRNALHVIVNTSIRLSWRAWIEKLIVIAKRERENSYSVFLCANTSFYPMRKARLDGASRQRWVVEKRGWGRGYSFHFPYYSRFHIGRKTQQISARRVITALLFKSELHHLYASCVISVQSHATWRQHSHRLTICVRLL